MDFAQVFKALSNENRLKVFEIIRRGRYSADCCKDEAPPEGIPSNAVCVCEILDQLNVSAPTLSHHLKELRNAGIVDVYNHGQWSYYNMSEGVLEMLAAYFRSGQPARKR